MTDSSGGSNAADCSYRSLLKLSQPVTKTTLMVSGELMDSGVDAVTSSLDNREDKMEVDDFRLGSFSAKGCVCVGESCDGLRATDLPPPGTKAVAEPKQ